MDNTCRVGNIRPSQLLWTYGPGAMIDLPNFSVMTMGLDSWKQDQCHLIDDRAFWSRCARCADRRSNGCFNRPSARRNRTIRTIRIPTSAFPCSRFLAGSVASSAG